MSRASYRPIAEATAFGAIANIGVQHDERVSILSIRNN